MPGTPAVFLRSCWMISSGVSLRSDAGLRPMKIVPLFDVARGPPAPTVEFTDATFSSFAMISATRAWRSAMAANELSCPPSVKAMMRPESPAGMKSFGTSV